MWRRKVSSKNWVQIFLLIKFFSLVASDLRNWKWTFRTKRLIIWKILIQIETSRAQNTDKTSELARVKRLNWDRQQNSRNKSFYHNVFCEETDIEKRKNLCLSPDSNPKPIARHITVHTTRPCRLMGGLTVFQPID